MSSAPDPGLAAFLEADGADAARAALSERLAAAGAEALTEALLREVSAEPEWRRHRALMRLREVSPAAALHAPLAAALRDGASAERRNAARSVLAALASQEPGGEEGARRLLEELATSDADADVRVLAASALGESCNPRAREALERALRDPQENVVSAAADALAVLGDGRAAAALGELARQGSLWGRISAVVALGRLRDRRGIPALAQAAEEPLLAQAAAHALGEIGDPAGLEPLRPLLSSGSPALRRVAHRAAASILAAHPDTPVPGWLRASVEGQEEELGEALAAQQDDCAARLLGVAGTRAAARRLVATLQAPELRPAALAGLALLPREVAAAALLERLPHGEAEERAALLTALPPVASPEELRQLLPYLADAHDGSRAAAAEALGRSPEGFVLPALVEALEDPASRRGAAQALGRLGPARCAPLGELIEDEDARVREAAADALASCAAQEGERIRAALARETDPGARRALIRALGAAGGGAEAIAELARMLESEEIALRFAAARALGETHDPQALPPLLAALADPAPEVQAAALRALGRLGDPRAAEPLTRQLDAADRDLRRTAAAALREIAPPAARARLLRALEDGDREIRLAAARTLERIGDPAAAPALREVAAADPDPLVREAAEHAFLALTRVTSAPEGGSA